MTVWGISCFWCDHLMYCVALVAFFISTQERHLQRCEITNTYLLHLHLLNIYLPPAPYIFRTDRLSRGIIDNLYFASLHAAFLTSTGKIKRHERRHKAGTETERETWMRTKGMFVSRICREHAALCLDFLIYSFLLLCSGHVTNPKTQQSAIFLVHLWVTATDST